MPGSLEAGPLAMPSRGTSKSAVSRTLGRRLTTTLAAQLEQRLDGLEVLALFLDGVVIAGQTVIVVLGLTREGRQAARWGCAWARRRTPSCAPSCCRICWRGGCRSPSACSA